MKLRFKIAKVKRKITNEIGKAAHHSQCQTPTVSNKVDGPIMHEITYIHASLLLINDNSVSNKRYSRIKSRTLIDR